MANLSYTDKHISELINRSPELHVTYSSVGYEAFLLGLNIKLILLPNKISRNVIYQLYFITYGLANTKRKQQKCFNLWDGRIQIIKRKEKYWVR